MQNLDADSGLNHPISSALGEGFSKFMFIYCSKT